MLKQGSSIAGARQMGVVFAAGENRESLSAWLTATAKIKVSEPKT